LIHLYVFDEIKKAKNSIKQSEISKDNANSTLILESVRNYFNLIKYKNLVELNQAKRDLNKSKYNASEKLFRNGSITLEDFQRIRNNFNISQNDVSLSENSLTEIKNEVFIFSGKELNDINDIKLTKIDHQKYNLDQLLSKAYSKNFMVNMSRENININRNEIASQKSRHYPTVDLVAEYDYLDLTQGGSQFGATTREDSTLSIVLNFPIFKGGYQSSKIKEARMNYEKARLEHKNSKRTVRKDIIDNLNRYNLSKKQYHTALQILKTNLKKYENAQLGFDKGIYSDTQVLETKTMYLESLSDAKNIMMDYVYSEMTIKYLLNELDMSSLRKVNTYLVW
ncbi:MAG: TolC family protein, partial [Gammaproteobacteria bacterium]